MEKLFCKKGITISLRCLLIVASLVFGSSAWGQTEITWNSDKDWTGIGTTNISYTSGDYTISASKATGGTNPTVNSKSYDFRTYANNTFTVSSSQENIIKIVFYISTNGKKQLTDIYDDKGTAAVPNLVTYTTTWEGDAKEITFTVDANNKYGTSTTKTAGQFCIDKLVIYKTGEDIGKTEATVTFDQKSYTVETNGSITVSATKNSTSPIVYSISPADGNVSINENTGEIHAGATAGTYTITATVAENESYTSASANCVLTITAPAPPSYNITAPLLFKQITSTDELVLGTQYIIANIAAGKGLPASGTITTVATISEENKANITDNTLVKSEYVENFAVLTLQKDENDNYVLINEDGQYFTGAEKTEISWQNAKGDYSTWKISFDGSGNALIVTTKTTGSARNIMISGSNIKYYASSNDYTKVQLYQKVTDLAISTLTNGYATFVTDVPYVMPKGACGYAVTVAPHVGVITKTEAYKGGQPVPAQTALLIGGALGTNYYPAVLKEDVTATYKGDNYMEGKRTEEGYTNSQKGVAVFYYKLALNSASKPGFYYGAADGAAFQLTKPTTAYLAVPKSITPVNGYLIDFEGETTGIDSIGQTDSNANGAIYNLNGIRMAQPLRSLPKGVYIVNGKKVIRF